MAASLKEIAERTGVSQMTVSRILRGQGEASRETIQAVEKAAQELGYRPNAAARALRDGRFNSIGILSSSEAAHGSLSPATRHQLQNEAMKRDLCVVSGLVWEDALADSTLAPRILREWMVDGIVMDYSFDAPKTLSDGMRMFHVPAVWVNVKQDTDCVYTDEYGAVREPVEKLIKMGHTRIYYRGRTDGYHYSVGDRCRGYLDAMTSAGQTGVVLPRDESRENFYKLCLELQKKDRPTAIVNTGNPMNIFIAAASVKLSIPEDLSVISVYDPAYVDAMAYSRNIGDIEFSGMQMPVYDMGRRIFELLMNKIESPSMEEEAIVLKYEWFEGSSVGPSPE